jgi:hypothetical protein
VKKDFFTFCSTAKDKSDYIIYNKTTGVLSYDVEEAGTGQVAAFAQLEKSLALTYGDFFVI